MEQKKIIIHFVPGSYGHFLEGLLNKSVINESLFNKSLEFEIDRGDFHWIKKDYNDEKILIERSHYYEEKTTEIVLKITYEQNDTDLISRNKWTKWPLNYEESKAQAFANLVSDVDEITKEIVTKSYFRLHLLKDVYKWNKKINNHTFEIPFKFFLLDKNQWISKAQEIFNVCGLPYDSNYLETAFDVFQKSQKKIFEAHKTYRSVVWQQKDIIEKSNELSNLYYEKILKNNKPIPPSKEYSNSSEMLATWVKSLNNNII